MLFGSSGVRRRYGRDLCDLALGIGTALAGMCGRVLLGSDTRTTSPVLRALISGGILSAGGEVLDAGIVPTPVIGFGARREGGGAMITASHNPEEYNGIKLFNPDGSAFSASQQSMIEEAIGKPGWAAWDRQGFAREIDAATPYIDAVLGKRRARPDLPLLLDCGNGAGSTVSPRLLSLQGVRLSCINCNPSGRFVRPSEPDPRHLAYLGSMVRSRGAAGAIVHDGDADRMMAFDQKGRFISGDHLMMLFIRYLGIREVVTTYDASMAIEELATVRRTPVGDSFVSAELTRWGRFGGEPSGAWIFPGHSLCPDGPYAAAVFAEMASEWDIAGEVDSMPSYPVFRESLACEQAREVLLALGAESPTDGIRVEGDDGWCLIRASGTEPKIRLTAEGRDQPSADAMLARGRTLLGSWKSA